MYYKLLPVAASINSINRQESCQVAKANEKIKEINSLPAYPPEPERSHYCKFCLKINYNRE